LAGKNPYDGGGTGFVIGLSGKIIFKNKTE
jgi:hypothetical protein